MRVTLSPPLPALLQANSTQHRRSASPSSSGVSEPWATHSPRFGLGPSEPFLQKPVLYCAARTRYVGEAKTVVEPLGGMIVFPDF
jgi:hypothetical protein